jgi:hypothetical protein
MADKKIPIERFLPLYMKAVEDGMTKEDFAKKVGLKPSTVYQRVYELRHGGLEIPLLKTAGRIPMLEKAKAILAEYKSEPSAKPKAKAKKPESAEIEEEVAATSDADISDPIAQLLG